MRRAVVDQRRQRDDRHVRTFARHKARRGARLDEAADRLDVGRLGDLARGGDDAVGDAFRG